MEILNWFLKIDKIQSKKLICQQFFSLPLVLIRKLKIEWSKKNIWNQARKSTEFSTYFQANLISIDDFWLTWKFLLFLGFLVEKSSNTCCWQTKIISLIYWNLVKEVERKIQLGKVCLFEKKNKNCREKLLIEQKSTKNLNHPIIAKK